MKINYAQIKRIHGLMKPEIKSDKDAKANLIRQFTNDAALCSTADLTFVQANELIESLGGVFIPGANNEWLKFDFKNPQHRKVLSLCRQFGWETIYKGKFIADLRALATWLQSEKSPVKKPINAMNRIELSKIITALDNMALHKFQKKCTTKNKTH